MRHGSQARGGTRKSASGAGEGIQDRTFSHFVPATLRSQLAEDAFEALQILTRCRIPAMCCSVMVLTLAHVMRRPLLSPGSSADLVEREAQLAASVE